MIAAHSTPQHVVLLFVVGCVLAPSATAVAARCQQDGDCPGTTLCRAQRCALVDCEQDAECAADHMCRAYRCVQRQCTLNSQCPVERRCDDGLCVLPPPPPLRNGNHGDDGRGMEPQQQPARRRVRRSGRQGAARPGAHPIEWSVGVSFPVGVLLNAAIKAGAGRSLSVGVASSPDYRGIGWRALVRGAPHPLGPVTFDGWAGLVGLFASQQRGVPAGTTVGAALQGSGRGLFSRNRGVAALWWTAGLGLTWRHGRFRHRSARHGSRGRNVPAQGRGRWFARLEVGALLLLADAYPVDRDYALLPAVSMHYGWTW